MDAKELRELLRGRLYIELQLFKDLLLIQDKDAIYQSACQIERYADIYEVLQADMDEMGEEALRALLHQRSGILEEIYQEWLSWDDGFFEEFREFVREKAGILQNRNDGIYRKEGIADGQEHDKAA